MRVQSPYPSAKHHQILFEAAVVTDGAGVLDSITDGPGYVDILTTATIGTIYLTIPIVTDQLGGPLGLGTKFVEGSIVVKEISGSATGDNYVVGWSDAADPTAGKWEGGGLENVAGSFAAVEEDELGGTTDVDTYALTDGGVWVPLLNHVGRSEWQTTAYLYDGTTWKDQKSNTLAGRLFTPAFFVLKVQQAAAAVQTHRVGVGSLIYPPTKAPLEIEPRS